MNRLIKPTELRSGESEERSATWLELFYDLVFVVAVAELGHHLATHLSVSGLVEFIGLFIPVWWAWFHYTIYADRFDTDDVTHRLLTILQMLIIAGLAASIHGAIGETYREVAISLVGVRVVMIVMYLRTRRIEVARPLARRLVGTFSLGGALWVASVFAPEPWRYALWAVAVAQEYLTVTIGSTRRLYARMPVSESHLPERFGLFTIIVLGESVVGVVAGLAEQDLRSVAAITGGLGLLLAFGIWWAYFGDLEGGVLKGLGGLSVVAWVYVHLPLTMGLTAVGIAVEHAIAEGTGHSLEPFGVWLFAGSMATVSTGIAVTNFATANVMKTDDRRRRGWWRLGVAVLSLLAGAVVIALEGTGLLIAFLLAVVSLSQVLSDLIGQQIALRRSQDVE